MTKHRIEAHRADGVLLVNLGSQQYVLINLAESLTTMAVDGSVVDRYGPWTNFDASARPEASVYGQVDSILSKPGHLVGADDIGPNDYEPQELASFQPDRKTITSMLKQAGLLAELTDTKNLQHDPDFLMRCMTTIVPQMSASGVHVGDPATFCSMLHMERTGLIPKRGDMPEPVVDMGIEPLPPTSLPDATHYSDEKDAANLIAQPEVAAVVEELVNEPVEEQVDANAVAQVVAPQQVQAAPPVVPVPQAPAVAAPVAPQVQAVPMPGTPMAPGVPALPTVKPIGKLFKHTKVAQRKVDSVGKPGVA